MTQTPRILLFTGDGKGKTTAALGLAFRASGHNLRTCVIQFIKGDASVGEVAK
ncbi:MAG: cob(I)yrinic acid a,c-diamide adenosyltransferase [Planctomycetota bacterium]|nr:cob(I)yrinic acid a,c-diamide adenosyltransferase [Planctomycetota bacterium]